MSQYKNNTGGLYNHISENGKLKGPMLMWTAFLTGLAIGLFVGFPVGGVATIWAAMEKI